MLSRNRSASSLVKNGLLGETGCFPHNWRFKKSLIMRGLRPLVVAIAEVENGSDGLFQRTAGPNGHLDFTSRAPGSP